MVCPEQWHCKIRASAGVQTPQHFRKERNLSFCLEDHGGNDSQSRMTVLRKVGKVLSCECQNKSSGALCETC